MPKYLSLQIPKPCHENWDKMNPSQQGKFCGSCQKNVIDFTSMSDAQLANFFKRSKGEVCGRFNSEQLETDIFIPKKRIPWVRYFFQIALPAFLFSYKGYTQGKVKADTTISSNDKSCNHNNQDRIVLGGAVPFETTRTIAGHIIDDQGYPIPFATVAIKNTKSGVAADAFGAFSVNVNNNSILVVSSAGRNSIEIICANLKYDTITVQLNAPAMMGEIIITRVRRKKKIKTTSTTSEPTCTINTFSLYPNPLPSSSRINIKWTLPVNSNQTCLIYDMNGKLIQEEKVEINNKSIETGFILSNLFPGTYILRLIDEKSNKSSSQQFIVQ